jgi:hypothetical protein
MRISAVAKERLGPRATMVTTLGVGLNYAHCSYSYKRPSAVGPLSPLTGPKCRFGPAPLLHLSSIMKESLLRVQLSSSRLSLRQC